MGSSAVAYWQGPCISNWFQMVITYHEIVPGGSPYAYSVDCERIDSHFAAIRQIEGNSGQTGLTFDDGHISHYEHGLPALHRHGLTATFFITAGWTGVRATSMNWPQLRELVRQGHRIGGHGWSHRLLTDCSHEELRSELRQSKRTLEDGLGRPVDVMSLPGGRISARVLDACAEEGYRMVYSSDPLAADSMRSGTLAVRGRLMIRRSTDAEMLRRWIREGYRRSAGAQVLASVKRGLRATIGDTLYSRAWKILASSPDRRRTKAELHG